MSLRTNHNSEDHFYGYEEWADDYDDSGLKIDMILRRDASYEDEYILLEKRKCNSCEILNEHWSRNMKRKLMIFGVVAGCIAGSISTNAEFIDKNTVKCVQEALNEAGYECGTPDGVPGQKTYGAIKDFQAENEQEPDGIISEQLLVALGLENNAIIVNSIPADEIVLTENEKTAQLIDPVHWILPSDWTCKLQDYTYYYYPPTETGEKYDAFITYQINDFSDWPLTAYSSDYKNQMIDSFTEAFHTGENYVIVSEEKDAEILGYQARLINMQYKSSGERTGYSKLAVVIIDNYFVIINFYQFDDAKIDYSDVFDRLMNTMYIDSDGSITQMINSTAEENDVEETGDVDENIDEGNDFNPEGQASEQPDIIASIENDYPIDIVAVKMVRKSGYQDVIHIKVRKNFEMAGNDDISVKYITVNNDGENVCDYGSAWVSALDQGQASWAHGNNVVDEITYEDLSYIKITEISYFKDNQGYYSYSLPESIKVYKDDIVLEEK